MGCKIKKNQHGKLAFRLFWEKIPGGRSWEGTGLADTPENRDLLEAKAKVIAAEMKSGTFDYLRWFPRGNKAHLFANLRPKDPTVSEYKELWITDKVPPLVRKSRARDYNQHFGAYLTPQIGYKKLSEIDVPELRVLRLFLVETKGLAVKTARNILAGTLQAFLRDAKADRVISANPFDELPDRWWPAIEHEAPDPFMEDERDKILRYYYGKGLYLYRYLYFQFWTGWRPSEATALRWGRIDIRNGKAEVARSRTLGAEAAPKTTKSRRTVDLLPNVVELLREMKPLHVTDDDYVFLNTEGRPLRLDNIRIKTWYNALRVLEVRPRKPSASRHTFISVMLSYGMPVQLVAERVGNSPATIEKHYGKYIRTDDAAGIKAMRASATFSATQTVDSPKSAKRFCGNQWSQRESNPSQAQSSDPPKNPLSIGNSTGNQNFDESVDSGIEPTKTGTKGT